MPAASPTAILASTVRALPRTHTGVVAAGAAAVALAATADTAQSVYERFAVDLSGLGALERAGVALWDLRPLGAAVFAASALGLLLVLPQPGFARLPLVLLLSAHAALGAAVLGLAVWLAAQGSVGAPDALGFRFGAGERALTLVTQALAWGPLVALFLVLALRLSEEPAEPPAQAEVQPLSEEMETLWRERLAFGPKRQRARALLGQIRALEEAGDRESARALAEEMRRL